MPDKSSRVPIITGTDPEHILGYAAIGNDKQHTLTLFDAHGKPITDLRQRIALQETLVSSLFNSWQQDQAQLYELTGINPDRPEAPIVQAEQKNALKIGYKANNGWYYAGISVTTGTALWVAEKGEKKNTGSWNTIIKNMQKKDVFRGYHMNGILNLLPLLGEGKSVERHLQEKDDGGVRLPTIAELKQLYENKKDLANCIISSDWHWSLTEFSKGLAYARSFKNGRKTEFEKPIAQAFVYARTEPRILLPH